MKRRFETCGVHHNKHGFRGVEWDAARQMFRARIRPTPDQQGRWLGRYATAEEAAQAYDHAARQVYGVDARLNFPGPDEQGSIPTQRALGKCPRGHDLAVEGYARPDGRGLNCRACNRDAQRRRSARATLAPSSANETPR